MCATAEFDPNLMVDRLVSAIFEFEDGTSTITCSTQLADYQFAKVFGTQGRIEIDRPFTPNPDHPATIVQHLRTGTTEFVFDACDQYTLQGDRFSEAIRNGVPAPESYDDAVMNMKVIDAVFESSQRGAWVSL